MKTSVMILAWTCGSRATALVAPPSTAAMPLLVTAKARLLDVLPQKSLIGSDSAQVKTIVEACEALEACSSISSSSSSSSSSSDATHDAATTSLHGTWKLRFTSASPYGLVDTTTMIPESMRKILIDDSLFLSNSIEQTVDTVSNRVVNTIALAPWPKLKYPSDDTTTTTTNNNNNNNNNNSKNSNNNNPLQQFVSAVAAPLVESLQAATILLELDHSFTTTVNNNNNNNRMELRLESIRRTLSSNTNLPAFIPRESNYKIPFSPTVSFETLYLDDTLRVDRGPLGETMVWERPILLKDMADTTTTTTTTTLLLEGMGDECEVAYEEDGTPVILCDNVEEGAMPSD